MKAPAISVALPVFNGADYLREALDSILAQDFTDFELVVSDNCSTDGTPEVLAEYASRDSRVCVSRTDSFLEQADNVNRSIELCTAPWVKLFCHDDIMLPDCLGTLYETITHDVTDRIGLIGDAPAWLFGNGYQYSVYGRENCQSRFCHGKRIVRSIVAGQPHEFVPALTTATVRRVGFLSSARFDRRFKHFDVFLWMKLLMDWDYVFVPRVLTLTRIHGAQVHVFTQKSLRTVEDHRLFWGEFLAEHRDELELSARTRLRARFRPVAAAGTVIAIELLKHSYRKAFQILLSLPVSWWPILPQFVVRAYWRELKKVKMLAEHVPVHLIYPE